MEPEKTRIIISMVVVMGFFAVFAAFVMLPIKGDQTTINMLVGAVISAFTSVLNYFVGTTSGSKSKDATLANIASSVVPAAAPVAPGNVTPLGRTAP
jgi:hypothetical protein